MQIRRRTDITTDPHFDVRFIQEKLQGEYDNVYIIFSTLDNESTDAWEEEGDSFLLIRLPKEEVQNGSIDYRSAILEHLPLLSWLDEEALLKYVTERWREKSKD